MNALIAGQYRPNGEYNYFVTLTLSDIVVDKQVFTSLWDAMEYIRTYGYMPLTITNQCPMYNNPSLAGKAAGETVEINGVRVLPIHTRFDDTVWIGKVGEEIKYTAPTWGDMMSLLAQEG